MYYIECSTLKADNLEKAPFKISQQYQHYYHKRDKDDS